VAEHAARNAEALARLAAWARTRVESPAAVLRSELASTAAALDDALERLDDQTWTATIRSARGREIPTAEIPWMRIHGMWTHPIDLRTGATFDDLPAGVVDLLLDDVTGALSGRRSGWAADRASHAAGQRSLPPTLAMKHPGTGLRRAGRPAPSRASGSSAWPAPARCPAASRPS
jgi:hypothetical protein